MGEFSRHSNYINDSSPAKMSRPVKDFDNKTLFDVLQKAIEDDRRYWIRNEAKIKASYTAKTYDEFRETVDAAHLAPLTKADKDKKIRKWNVMADGQN